MKTIASNLTRRLDPIRGYIGFSFHWIGGLTVLRSTTSFEPQAWKIISSRRRISGAMYTITVAGFAFWLVYGVMKGYWPIIVYVCYGYFHSHDETSATEQKKTRPPPPPLQVGQPAGAPPFSSNNLP